MLHDVCCTCATLFSALARVSSSEKPLPENKQLDCCGRIICHGCIQACRPSNPRFLSYCPYCQVSGRSPLAHRLKDRPRGREPTSTPATTLDPPPYSTVAPAIISPPGTPATRPDLTDSSYPPPPYPPSPVTTATATTATPSRPNPQDNQPPAAPTPHPTTSITHHLRHTHPHDTIPSLSLCYGIPAARLRRHNNLTSDHLLAARQTLLIPTPNPSPNPSPNPAPNLSSLSPHPVEDAAERQRKTTVRRWMVACKEADYDVAVVYLAGVGYDLDAGVRRYWDDERWVGGHPGPAGASAGAGSGAGFGSVGGDGRGRGRGRGAGREARREGKAGRWWGWGLGDR
ncbi:hypothetical protein BT67DRAFT_414630 [Trichocladium antarcticum]|uniref:LysM domain-containing protein n=1 Tax=Trichocladium antarcticum TaxID=1450529 RepID=A0AAN6URA2_9PEZI|nr:hypothetical protein BT67DRAFT_414630 [Trichocladium antarcticum]